MRRLMIAVAVLAVVAFGCDTSEPLPPGVTTTTTRPPPEPPPTPEEVQELEDCDDLVEVGVRFVENMVQSLEGDLSTDVLTGAAAPPADIQLLIDVGREVDRRAIRLNCDVAELNNAIVAEIDGLESMDPVVGMFLDIVRARAVGSSGATSTIAP